MLVNGIITVVIIKKKNNYFSILIDEEFKEFFTNDKSLQIDMKNFEWDSVKNFWRPSKSTGDMYVFFFDHLFVCLLILNLYKYLKEIHSSTRET